MYNILRAFCMVLVCTPLAAVAADLDRAFRFDEDGKWKKLAAVIGFAIIVFVGYLLAFNSTP